MQDEEINRSLEEKRQKKIKRLKKEAEERKLSLKIEAEKEEEKRKKEYRIIKLCEISKQYLGEPKGTFLKRCPECKNRLKIRRFETRSNIISEYKYFYCVNCDYEYALLIKERNISKESTHSEVCD